MIASAHIFTVIFIPFRDPPDFIFTSCFGLRAIYKYQVKKTLFKEEYQAMIAYR
jgi:hypothetical protein